MKKGIIYTAAGAIALLGVASPARALVLPVKSEPQQIRASISAQNQGLTACVVKANLACEKGTAPVQDCFVSTGTTTPMSGADAKGKFVADLAKCASKVNYMSKAKTTTPSTAYQSIGCVGDSDAGTPGTQPFTNMTTYQNYSTSYVNTQVQLLGSLIPGIAAGAPYNCTDQACVSGVSSVLAKWTGGVQKCQAACENDYSNKKGDGGPVDLPSPCTISSDGTTGAVGAAPAFTACIEKNYASASKKIVPPAIGVIAGILQTALDNFYNLPSNCQ